jgi:hypothetical protein
MRSAPLVATTAAQSGGRLTWGNVLCGSVRADQDLVGLRGRVGRCSGLCVALGVLCLGTGRLPISGVVIIRLTTTFGAPRPSRRPAVADSPGMTLQAARQSTGGRG